jgi:hypothetical protein
MPENYAALRHNQAQHRNTEKTEKSADRHRGFHIVAIELPRFYSGLALRSKE